MSVMPIILLRSLPPMLLAAEDKNDQQELRIRLKAIRDSPSLTQDEKRMGMQAVMQNSTRCGSCTPTTGRSSSQHSTDSSTRIVQTPNFATKCRHYIKSCSQFYFRCCDTVDPCFRCHQERGTCHAAELPPQIVTISCNVCGKRQPPSARCDDSSCNAVFGSSHCSICMIWTQAEITHCDKCGLCRSGSKDSIFHCDTCEACFPTVYKNNHKCSRISLKDQVCPMCLEGIHSSQKRCDLLRCGHSAHYDCLRDSWAKWDPRNSMNPPRCPTCRKSLFAPEALKPYWEAMRFAIQVQPLTADVIAIGVGDTVSSPLGPFVIDEIFDAMDDNFANKPVPSVTGYSTRSNSKRISPVVTMCSGILLASPEETATAVVSAADGTETITTSSRMRMPQKVKFQLNMVRKEMQVLTLCYDCDAKGLSPFHFIGLECGSCHGFNTVQM